MNMDLEKWTPRPQPGQHNLDGLYTKLEVLNWDKHGDELFSAISGDNNKGLWEHVPFGPHQSLEHFKEELEYVRVNMGWQTYVIISRVTGAAEGMFSLMRIRPEHGSAEVGAVVFGEKLKKSTVATEALFLLGDHLFTELGYRGFEWKCHNLNEASKVAAVRFGFSFEGVFRNDMVVRGRNRDTAWYAMIDQEWPPIKESYEQWLSKNNFSSDGTQIRSLKYFMP